MARMQDFRTYFLGLTADEREAFADRVKASPGTLTQVAYGHRRVELGLADVICAQSGHVVTLDGLPLTEKAKQQRRLREPSKEAA